MQKQGFENTQTQLKLQEQLDAIADDVINSVEVVKAGGVSLILENEFDAAGQVIEQLREINEILGGERV